MSAVSSSPPPSSLSSDLISEHPRMRPARRHEVFELLPSALPRWMDTQRVAMTMLAFSAAMTTTLLTVILHFTGVERVLLIVLGVASSTVGSLYACRSTSRPQAMLRSIGAGIAHAVFLVAVVVPTLVLLFEGRRQTAVSLFGECAFGALIVGAPLGTLLGLVHAVLPSVAADARERPSHADVDHVLTVGAVWLLLVGAVHWFGKWFAIVSFTTQSPSTPDDPVATVASLLPIVGSLVAFGFAVAHRRKRSQFMHAVLKGQRKEFRIVRRARQWETMGILPLERGNASLCEYILIHSKKPCENVATYRVPATRDDTEDRVVALWPEEG